MEHDFLILLDNCFTCKHRNENFCDVLNVEIDDCLDFICDFYKQKNSGAFRRKRRKVKKLVHERKSNK